VTEKRKKREPKSHSEADRAAALILLKKNNGNLLATARQLKSVTAAMLRRWRDESQQGEPPDPESPEERDMATTFESIAWQLLGDMPHKIGDASLNQITSTLKYVLDAMRSVKAEQLNTSTLRLDLSGMTDEDLEQLERITTLVLRHCQSSSVPEHPGEEPPSDPRSDRPAAPGVEPAVPAEPLPAEGDDAGEP
jgi:transposase-like protein